MRATGMRVLRCSPGRRGGAHSRPIAGRDGRQACCHPDQPLPDDAGHAVCAVLSSGTRRHQQVRCAARVRAAGGRMTTANWGGTGFSMVDLEAMPLAEREELLAETIVSI